VTSTLEPGAAGTVAEAARLVPVLELGATRSSHRWQQPPGNFDRLNMRALFDSDNQWGIPVVPDHRIVPDRLVAYTDRRGTITAAADQSRLTAVHFFLDDYRFEVLWSKPERGLSRCCSVGAALTPDFSLYRNMPLAMQLWQVYRSRWCGAWLAYHGVRVVPTVSWSTPDTYPFAFAGIPTGSVVAVSTVGIWRDRDARTLFSAGFTEMIHRLRPSTVLVYGQPPSCSVPAGTTMRCYPSRWNTQIRDEC
jgi:hypothetical protein